MNTHTTASRGFGAYAGRNALGDVKRAAAKAGGTVEEDTGYRDMRVLQVVAPHGYLWVGNDCQCTRVEWATGKAPHAISANEQTFASLAEMLSHGLREMTAEECELYAEE
jgi:hypothetical protein